MAYQNDHIITLGQLEMLASLVADRYVNDDEFTTLGSEVTDIRTTLDSLSTTVEGIVSTGGEANIIESISVNGTAQTISDKNVNITVPTALSALTNDSGYQTASEVSTAIATAIAATGHASYQVADSVPSASEAEENVLYLVMNSDTGYYDIYALVGGVVVLLDDTSVDLTDYVTNDALASTLTSYVTSTALTSKLLDYVLYEDIASDDEVTEMLENVFPES